jgi:hypothetical protein
MLHRSQHEVVDDWHTLGMRLVAMGGEFKSPTL